MMLQTNENYRKVQFSSDTACRYNSKAVALSEQK